MRRISGDEKEVLADSLGRRSNPNYPDDQKMTPAAYEMTKPHTWAKRTSLPGQSGVGAI